MTAAREGFDGSDVSVVVGVYNNAATIAEAIESILAQTVPPGEVLVVDDGSTDGSGDVARAFGERVRVVRQANEGVSGARNRGVAETSRPLIAALDADDRWAPRKLELQLPALVPWVEAVSCHVAQVPQSEWSSVLAGDRPPTSVLHGPVWETLLIRREAFARIGPFDTSYKVAEQIDWWSRAADAGLRLVAVDEPLVFRRLHADNHGLRNMDKRSEYARAVHAALVRRRAAASAASPALEE